MRLAAVVVVTMAACGRNGFDVRIGADATASSDGLDASAIGDAPLTSDGIVASPCGATGLLTDGFDDGVAPPLFSALTAAGLTLVETGSNVEVDLGASVGAAKYTYYSALVTSLGVTPKPDC